MQKVNDVFGAIAIDNFRRCLSIIPSRTSWPSRLSLFFMLLVALGPLKIGLAYGNTLDFVTPTDPANYVTERNYSHVNVSVNSSGLNLTAFIDWNRSLVGWWRLNNESGESPTFFRDWSGWGNKGTCSGSSCPIITTSGQFGNASQFTDTEDDHINVSDSPSLNPTSEITIEAWIYNDGANNCKGIVDKNRDAAYSLHLPCDSQKVRIQGVFGGGGQTLDSNSATLSNVWTHVATTYNGSEMRVYINGTLEGFKSVTGAIGVSPANLTIGRFHDFGPWKGRMDEVRLWTRGLSEQEIRASYNASRYWLERNFTGLALGAYTYRAYSQNATGHVNDTALRTLNVVADATPPVIYASSPANQSYSSQSVWFNVTLNEAGSWAGFSIDGRQNNTLLNSSGNWNLLNSSMVDGLHNVTFYANDTSNNMNSTSVYFTVSTATTPTSTPTPAPTAIAHGGGGGGTFVGGTETHPIGPLPAGGTAKFTIQRQASLGVTEIVLETKRDIAGGEAKITIERLDGRPANIASDPEGERAYGYLDIFLSNLANESISKAVINFRVEKSWLSEGKYAAVALYRWQGEWRGLPTRLSAEDETYKYYSAESPGLSFFAITSLAVAPPPKAMPTPTPLRTPTRTPALKPEPMAMPNATINVTHVVGNITGAVTNITQIVANGKKAVSESVERLGRQVNPVGFAISVVMLSSLLWMAINSARLHSKIYQHLGVGLIIGGIILWLLAFRLAIPVKSLIAAGALGLILMAYIILAKGGRES